MPAINATIVVDQTNLTLTPTTTNLGVTVEPINLGVFTTSPIPVGGDIGQLQYNLNGVAFAGVPGSEFINGNLTLGANANVKLTGGTNGYFLQTDGSGNLVWNGGTSTPGAPGSPGGAASQVQYNDGTTSFAGAVGFTYDSVTANVAMGANLSVFDTVSSNTAVFNSLTVAGTTTIQQAKEKVTPSTATAVSIDYDVLDQAILLQTVDMISGMSLNFRGNATTTLNNVMSTDESMTLTWISKNGPGNAYPLNAVSIDGVAQTLKWVQPTGAPSIGTYNGNDMYTFNIIKTATNTYTIFANRISYL